MLRCPVKSARARACVRTLRAEFRVSSESSAGAHRKMRSLVVALNTTVYSLARVNRPHSAHRCTESSATLALQQSLFARTHVAPHTRSKRRRPSWKLLHPPLLLLLPRPPCLRALASPRRPTSSPAPSRPPHPSPHAPPGSRTRAQSTCKCNSCRAALRNRLARRAAARHPRRFSATPHVQRQMRA